MVRRATKKSQQQKKRTTKRLLVLASEGSNKTEKTYFNEFNAKQDKYRIIHANGNNTDPVKIVQDAMNSADKEELDYQYGDMAVAVFDVDFGKEKQIKEAINLANANNVKVILSNPCFEVWLLLHFRFSTKSYVNNDAAVSELVKYWSNYNKNINSYQSISAKTIEAIKNAKRVKKYFKADDDSVDVMKHNSSTDVYQLVELLVENNS